MDEEKKTIDNNIGQSEIIEVKPVDSPSKNTLVTEHLQKMPNIFSRGLIYIILLLLVTVTVYSLLGEMDIVAECQAVARPVSHKIRVVSDRTGYVEQLYISEGQDVEADASLFLIRSREPVEQSAQIKELKIEQNRSALESINSELDFQLKEVNRLSKELNDAKKLLEKGEISQREHDNTKSKLDKARTEVKKLNSRKQIILNEKRILELEMDMEQKESEKVIKAENAGTISELFFRNVGDYVQETDLLCTIVPSDSPMYMDILVENKDIGFIEEEMNIKYKFEAFPYEDYGVLLGKVSIISPSAVDDKDMGYVYHVQGSLINSFYEIEGKKYPIKVGMTAVAEIVTERKSIFSVLF